MKKHYKIFSFAILVAATAFSSCTKEKAVFDADSSGGVVEIAGLPSRTSTTSYQSVAKAFDAKPVVNFPITLNYTGVNGAPEDVTVTMAIDTSLITKFNKAEGQKYVPLTANLYTVPSYTVVIPKGQKSAVFNITLNTAAFNFSLPYALPVTVKSTSKGVPSGNYGTGIYPISAKNQWDGIYTVTSGTMVDVTSASLTHINNYLAANSRGNMQYNLVTVSATECAIYDNYVYSGGFLSTITSGGTAVSNYGTFSAVLKFDATTNKVVAVANYQAQPYQATNPANGRTAGLDATGINTYNPATKTISVKYNMFQPSVVALPNPRSTWTEVMTYLKARP